MDDDGIFGPITRGAVSRFQQRMGLAVTGAVDAKTWAALFKSNISFVGQGGKTVTTISNGGGSAAETQNDSRPAASAPTTKPAGTKTKSKTKRPATSAPNSTSTDATTNRNTRTKPLGTTPVSNPAPAPAPVSTGGGCGSGQLATPVSRHRDRLLR